MKHASFLLAVSGFVVLGAAPASAHHSVAMFDMAHTVTMSGTIKAFEWTNPHAVVWFVTVDDKGQEQLIPVETTSPGNLMRSGWTKHSLRTPATRWPVSYIHLRNGHNGGALQRVTLTDTGKRFGLLAAEQQSRGLILRAAHRRIRSAFYALPPHLRGGRFGSCSRLSNSSGHRITLPPDVFSAPDLCSGRHHARGKR